MKRRRARIAAVAMLVMIAGSGIGARADDATQAINLRKTVVVQVVERVKPAVVNISARTVVTRRINPFGNDPFFQQFDMGDLVKVPANSLGSGFIIHRDGYVVTNNHVIDHARQITVQQADGKTFDAQVVAADPHADLAILKINSDKPFDTVELGDSSDLMIGEPAIAIGNALGYSHSVSTGIVSALHRDIRENAGGGNEISDLIQTDAAINPGNSGGPLLNAYGQVIGINTAIRSDAQNIGFAIPVNRLRELIPELMNPATAKKLDVGVKLTEERKLSPPANIVADVHEAGADGKEVKAIDGTPLTNIVDAYDLLLKGKLGQPMTLTLADGTTQTIVPKIAPLPDAILQAKDRLGLTVEQLTPALADKYHLNDDDGLLIDAVLRDSAAANAGVQPGDILVALAGTQISTTDDLASVLARLPQAGTVHIGISREGEVGFGDITLPAAKTMP